MQFTRVAKMLRVQFGEDIKALSGFSLVSPIYMTGFRGSSLQTFPGK